MDARNRIIMRKRSQLVDARDRLGQIARSQDARLKLDTLRTGTGTGTAPPRPFRAVPASQRTGKPFMKRDRRSRPYSGNVPRGRAPPLGSPREMCSVFLSGGNVNVNVKRQVQSVPFFRDRLYSMREDVLPEEYSAPAVPMPMPIVRSVENDFGRFSALPVSRGTERRPNRKNAFNRPDIKRHRPDLNLKIVAKNLEASSAGILKRSHRNDAMTPPSILKRRQPNAANGSGPDGYRILVSNLRSSVTAADIHELFGDIGELTDSKLVRPGTAEVLYGSLKDARRAVDVYHNRQLDGQPMNCFLVNPRNRPGPPSRSPPGDSGRRTLPASSNSSVIPDVSTVHKVLFGVGE